MNDLSCGFLEVPIQVLSILGVVSSAVLITFTGRRLVEIYKLNKNSKNEAKLKYITTKENQKVVEVAENKYENFDDVVTDDVAGERVTIGDVTAEPTAPTRDVIYEDLNDENIYEDLQTYREK